MNFGTRVEFKQHISFDALADRPKDVNQFHGYLNCPESIARYNILEVRGSLWMVASSNAEAGHASNDYVAPTQLIGIVAIDNQVLKLLERDN